jgi:hypothetical protein
MSPEAYRHLSSRLHAFLKTDITFDILANFLRQHKALQECFQIAHTCCGKPRYIEAEKVYHYEHSSNLRIGGDTQAKLLHEIDEDEFYPEPLPGRILLDEIESFFKSHDISVDSPGDIETLKNFLCHCCYNVEEVVHDLLRFCRVEPRLPSARKQWRTQTPVDLDVNASRESLREHLEEQRLDNPVADLAFMAYRDMAAAPWKPFLKAAVERNPVSVQGAEDLGINEAAEKITGMENESIYDGTRVAQPDEVWNFGRGDGIEKALCLMNIIKSRAPEDDVHLKGNGSTVCISHRGREFTFITRKNLPLPDEDDFSW